MTGRPLRSPAAAPDPFQEIRPLSLRTLHGANFWSPRPVTRLDLVVGEFDEIPSSAIPGFTDAFIEVLPGLVEHRCNIGERGGFIQRLRRGTYAPHIIEHVALELQTLIGHDVGFGRARGGDRPGEYTVAMEHLHTGVGLRAAAIALDLVQRAFARQPLEIDAAVRELVEIADDPDAPPISRSVFCGVVGGPNRALVGAELRRLGEEGSVAEVSPGDLLNAGLPYATSEFAVVLDSAIGDLPGRYRERDYADRLLSVVADAVPHGGYVVVPAEETGVQDLILQSGRRLAVFETAAERKVATSDGIIARMHDTTIAILDGEGSFEYGRLRSDAPAAAQLAAQLIAHLQMYHNDQP